MRNEIKDIKKAHVNLMNMQDHQIRELRQKVAWYEQAIENIKRDIDIYRLDCLLSLVDQDEKCKQCTAVTFNSVQHIIDKNLKEIDEMPWWIGKRCNDCGNEKCKSLGKLPKGYDCALWQSKREK